MCEPAFEISITQQGSFIRIDTNSTHSREVLMSSIRGLNTIRGSVLRINLGCSPMADIYIPFQNVIEPLFLNVEALRLALQEWLTASLPSEDTAIETLNMLTAIKENTEASMVNSNEIKLDVDKIRIEMELFGKPLLIDDTNPLVIYEGYADVGSLTHLPLWAIKRSTSFGSEQKVEWANGNKDFVHIWDNRLALPYV